MVPTADAQHCAVDANNSCPLVVLDCVGKIFSDGGVADGGSRIGDGFDGKFPGLLHGFMKRPDGVNIAQSHISTLAKQR